MVKLANHERDGEKLALAPLVYHALIVVVCPASIVAGVADKVQVAPPPPPIPLQSALQCPGVPLSVHSSQTSVGVRDCECRLIVSPSTSIPSTLASSFVPSPQYAT